MLPSKACFCIVAFALQYIPEHVTVCACPSQPLYACSIVGSGQLPANTELKSVPVYMVGLTFLTLGQIRPAVTRLCYSVCHTGARFCLGGRPTTQVAAIDLHRCHAVQDFRGARGIHTMSMLCGIFSSSYSVQRKNGQPAKSMQQSPDGRPHTDPRDADPSVTKFKKIYTSTASKCSIFDRLDR